MPSCCVPQCKNYYEKGFSLYLLPADPTRKALWIANIGRHDLNSSKKWFICEVHFSENMWEKPRIDGKRKLKQNAVPTIFNNNILTCDADIRNIKNHKSILQTVPDNELFNVCDRISSETHVPMKTSNLSERSFTETEKQSSATENVSESPTICNENDHDNLKQKLQHAELRAQEATLKLQQANVIINRIEKSRRILKKHVRRLIEEKKRIAQDNLKSQLQLNLKRIFNDDQIQILLGRNSRDFKWSNNTILKALQLRFSCGSNGYNELLAQHMPLPSERTLQRKKEDDREKDAVIAIDEMSIVSGEQFDPSTLSYIGNANILDSSEQVQKATHALVIMLAGIFSRWKQVVAYYYTLNGFNGAILKVKLEAIIRKAESIGFYVHSITSDMGSVNQAMWKAFGNISGRKFSLIHNSICHPVDDKRKLFFLLMRHIF
ncbi:uncharacterized protein [Linepithema humile]|uniref:uncharacterized protein isoform X2 n=1 Tax=Linepithema humile TaxID=83485 RepID=UPI00351F17F3